MDDVMRFLADLKQGDPRAAADLLPLVYDELRKLAGQAGQRVRRPGQTIQATALVHEAYLNLVGGARERSWDGRARTFPPRRPRRCGRSSSIAAREKGPD